MKKLLVLVMMLVMMSLTACGKATRTTETWSCDPETGKKELIEVEEEEIDGIFDEKAVVTITVH